MICDGCTHEENCPAKAEYGGAKRCSAFKPQEMTNEEHLKSCNNKELANAIFSAFVESATMIGCCVTLEYFRTQIELIDAIREWLKQPHPNE